MGSRQDIPGKKASLGCMRLWDQGKIWPRNKANLGMRM